MEKEIKDQPTAEKKRIRQEDAKLLLDAFKTWLDKSAIQVTPKSAIGKAIGYSLRQWSKLLCYIEHCNLNIDNNRAERAIKPFVIGRKNWMFANTANGAKASETLYSLIETAKANGLVPFDYIKFVLDELPKKPIALITFCPGLSIRHSLKITTMCLSPDVYEILSKKAGIHYVMGYCDSGICLAS